MSYPYFPQPGPNDPPPSKRRPQLSIPPPKTTFSNIIIRGIDVAEKEDQNSELKGFLSYSGGYITYPPPAGKSIGLNLAWHPYNMNSSTVALVQARADAESLAFRY